MTFIAAKVTKPLSVIDLIAFTLSNPLAVYTTKFQSVTLLLVVISNTWITSFFW
jgi:hypothetical protein